MRMKIADYVTIADAAEMLGCNSRAIHRALARCPEDICVTIYGRRMIIRVAVPMLKKYWYQRGSVAAAAQCKRDGSKGGLKKKANQRAAENGGGGKAP